MHRCKADVSVVNHKAQSCTDIQAMRIRRTDRRFAMARRTLKQVMRTLVKEEAGDTCEQVWPDLQLMGELTQSRPLEADRREFFCQVEAFAGLVVLNVVPLAGKAHEGAQSNMSCILALSTSMPLCSGCPLNNVRGAPLYQPVFAPCTGTLSKVNCQHERADSMVELILFLSSL